MRGARVAAVCYLALVGLHLPLLRLPYYWDEAGYFIFAGLDFFRHGWWAPHSTLANGHPPLLSLYLAAAWAVVGFHPLVTRLAMLGWAAALLAAVHALARPRLGSSRAWVTVALVGLAPLVFAQATLAQLDLPAAALILWALVAWERGRAGRCAAILVAACLMKETAVLAPVALLLAGRGRARRWMLVPVAALGVWFLWFHHLTGYWLGNPQYLAYNVGQVALSTPRIGLALLRRLWQLTGYDAIGGLTLTAVAGWWHARRQGVAVVMPREWLAVIVAYVGFHAVVGGAVLARYLLPALALYLLWATELTLLLPRAGVWVGLVGALLVAGWFWNPPYPFPFEDNLAYVQFVRLHQQVARELAQHPPAGAVWTAWPATDELTRPELGYVDHPLPVHALEDFTRTTLAGAEGAPAALYLYSRDYQPRWDLAQAASFWAGWAQRYFHYQRPAPATLWMAKLRLRPEFTASRRGQWVLLAVPGDR